MITGEYQGFDVRLEDPGIAVVTFTRPERLNAISTGARRDLVEVLTMAQLDDTVRVIVLTATGRGFVAGVNNRAQQPEEATLVPPVPTHGHVPVDLYGRLAFHAGAPRTIRRADKLTIAAVNGFAIQLGLSIVLAATSRSQRGRRPRQRDVAHGVAARRGWALAPRGAHLGVKGALDFLMRTRIVDAEEAQRLGLVNEVVDDDDLLPRALELARELADGPQVAMRLLKKAVYNAAALTFDQAGDDIASKTAISDFHRDAREGGPAFFEKRTVEFNQWLLADDPDAELL